MSGFLSVDFFSLYNFGRTMFEKKAPMTDVSNPSIT